jgi:hypothetical protein
VGSTNSYSEECFSEGRAGGTGVEFWNQEGDGPKSLGTTDLDDDRH